MIAAAITLAIYIASTTACLAISWHLIEERYAKARTMPFDVSFCVGIAGFSVFPFLNSAIAILVGFYLIEWARSEAAR